jgi:hypothetical protein
MMLDALPRESAALNALEPRWRKLGYTLVREPSPEQLPSFLKGFRPDAIAIGADPQLVIEVLTNRGGAAATRARQLQSLFAGHTDWRLELVYVGADEPAIEAAPADEIRKALERLRPLVDRDPGPAFLMAWATLEAAGRLLEPSLASRGLSSRSLLDLLVSNGHLPQSEGAKLRRLGDKRNALAHGQINAAPSTAEVRGLMDVIERLIETPPP